MPLIKSYVKIYVSALDNMLKVIRSIRLLHIYAKLTVIPEVIGYLHHLRYLRDKNNLSNLHYFNIQRFLTRHHLNFSGIGKLKFLQQLHEFTIKNENGYRIELEHINELCILEICNLKDVRDAQEACNAKLCDKRKLTHLSLDWGTRLSHVDLDIDERILDNLQPHNYLKTLQIQCYMGARSAIWMNEANLIKNLEKIHLIGCLEWKIIPPFGQLPFLKTLRFENMTEVKQLENKFHGNDIDASFHH